MRRFVLLAACLGLAAVPTLATQAQQPARDVIAGQVVSDADSHPLPRARVTLNDLKNERLVATVFTDAEGQFRFDPLPAGKYRLTGNAPRYTSASYMQHQQYSTAIVSGAGFKTDTLELRLVPLSTLIGHVTDNGEPIQFAQITLYREDLTNTERVTRVNSVITDDDGLYEFSRLIPGTYFLSAAARPWYAVHPPSTPKDAVVPYRTAVDPGLDVGYPLTFYPHALSSTEATPLTIAAGQQIIADMQIHAEHAVTLTLPAPPADKQNNRFPQLTEKVFGEDVLLSNIQMDNTDGERKLYGMTAGVYKIQELTPNGLPAFSQSVDLSTGSASVDLSAPAVLANVTLTVHMPGGASLPNKAQVSLREFRSGRGASSEINDKGVAEFKDIPAGDYRLLFYGGGHVLNVLSLTSGGKRSAGNRLHIAASGNAEADVIVSSASVQIQGFARRSQPPDDKPSTAKNSAGAMVVLVPAGADMSADLFRRDQSDLDGSFLLSGIAPGNYIVVAIDDGWPLRWTDPTALGPYLLHGTPVTIPATGPTTIQLSEPIIIQPR